VPAGCSSSQSALSINAECCVTWQSVGLAPVVCCGRTFQHGLLIVTVRRRVLAQVGGKVDEALGAVKQNVGHAVGAHQ